jgi:integrase
LNYSAGTDSPRQSHATPRSLQSLDAPELGERAALDPTARVQGEGAANGTINRELAALKRALMLAHRAERIGRMPLIEMLQEANAREGFFEREQFEAVCRHLPDPLRPLATFAYITGWRTKSEVLSLQWRQVDFEAGTVRLEPGTTKNREGRDQGLSGRLAQRLQACRRP